MTTAISGSIWQLSLKKLLSVKFWCVKEEYAQLFENARYRYINICTDYISVRQSLPHVQYFEQTCSNRLSAEADSETPTTFYQAGYSRDGQNRKLSVIFLLIWGGGI